MKYTKDVNKDSRLKDKDKHQGLEEVGLEV